MGLQRLSIACLLTTLLLCTTPCQAWGGSKDKVPIKSLDVITLQSGQMTTGRRSSPVPQLTYKGSRSLDHYTPTSVQCYNRGHDGYDVQWECVAELPVEVRFAKVNVGCEGYEYPDDPNVLKGSCGLEYTLELTGAGKSRSDNHYGYTGSQYTDQQSSGPSLFVLLCIGGVIYLVYSKLQAPSPTPSPSRESNPPQQPPRGNRLYPDLTPPPYSATEPSAPEPPPPYGWADDTRPGASNRKTHTTDRSPPMDSGPSQSHTRTQTNANTSDQSGPGFWSGTMLGGVAGYLFGNRNRGYNHHNGHYNDGYGRGYGGGGGGGGWGTGWGSGWGTGWGSRTHRRQTGGWGSSWFGGGGGNSYSGGSGWSGSGGRTSYSSAGSGTTRRSTGFGGTTRR